MVVGNIDRDFTSWGLVAGVRESEDEEWLTSYVIQKLHQQMCEGPLVDHSCNVRTCDYVKQMSFHYIEVDNYARRATIGNFEGKNVKYKPRLIINAVNFTPKLKEELRTAGKEKALDLIVTEAVFQIFKARHKLIFYEHIEPHKLRWEIINL